MQRRIPLSLFVLAVCAAAIVLGWQAKTIVELRAEVNTLRKDLQSALTTALENSTGPATDAEQGRREKLELIKLRHQVRELSERMAASHAAEPAKLQELLIALLPAATPGPLTLRPEWKGSMAALATNQYALAMQALHSATNEYMRYVSLGRAAKMSQAVGRTEDARKFATDMLVLNEKYSRGSPEKANGDVAHDANLVLGRIAVEEGRLEEAKKHLLASGRSTGSPVLGSFGPNMGLAKDLLEKGEQQTVLQYFESCRKFWTSHSGKLDEWSKEVEAGRIPEFGGNLFY